MTILGVFVCSANLWSKIYNILSSLYFKHIFSSSGVTSSYNICLFVIIMFYSLHNIIKPNIT